MEPCCSTLVPSVWNVTDVFGIGDHGLILAGLPRWVCSTVR